jgi:hypothetical protein
LRNPYLLSPEVRAKHEAVRAAGWHRRAEFEAAVHDPEAASERQGSMTPDEFLRILDADGPFAPV